VRDFFVLPRLSGKAKGREVTAVKCDSNLFRTVREVVEAEHPSFEFSQKAALEAALLEWLEKKGTPQAQGARVKLDKVVSRVG
jgi:hypothetical protein